jgi:O-methyltransferase involved in polyketide biosynthesis
MSEHVPGLDTSRPSSARFWDYLLGGKDNYAIDRTAAERTLEVFPQLRDSARADRAFLGRAVRLLAGEKEVRQFLDIGTGLPTADNTHQVAQWVAPQSRIVYVDNDPTVMLHAKALLTSDPRGFTGYIEADVRDPRTILDRAAQSLDFTRPIALMLLGILNFVPDDEQAADVVHQLVGALAPGSYLVLAHPTEEVHGEAQAATMRAWNASGAPPITARDPRRISRFFDGLNLLEPGVVSATQWRPSKPTDEIVTQYVAVGVKP